MIYFVMLILALYFFKLTLADFENISYPESWCMILGGYKMSGLFVPLYFNWFIFGDPG